jgi:hypothetical protein|tara:strand:- start:105 stop:494 length:390 start_codon:yes stop_codon:yes gene_type:complete
MMDHYSNYEGPTRDSAIKIIQEKLNDKPDWLKKYVVFYVDEEISKYGGLGSYTGWNVSTQHSIMNKLMYEYKIQLQIRARNNLKKLYNSMKVYGIFLKMYKYIHYKYIFIPNGNYMLNIQEKYNPIFNK